jgi:hypothetical protein
MVINLSATVGVGQPAANVKPNRRQSYLYKKAGSFFIFFCLLNNFFFITFNFFRLTLMFYSNQKFFSFFAATFYYH